MSEIETVSKATAPAGIWSPIVELRQYTLRPGKRDLLVELFDREFVESQEALGMKVIGQFRSLDDPDRFTWLRGFPDMAARAQALEAFYDGPVWQRHRDAANATMIDSDNVLLLRPAGQRSGFALDSKRPPPGSKSSSAGIVVATIYHLDESRIDEFVDFFERAISPVLTDAGASILATFVTADTANNFPRLPIREGEHVFVCFTAFADAPAYDRHRTSLAEQTVWKLLGQDLGPGLTREPETLKLRPTARSQVTGREGSGS